MKLFFGYIIGCLTLIAGCAGNSKKISTDTSHTTASPAVSQTSNQKNKFNISPYYINKDYLVVDTGAYSNGPMFGRYAIIRGINKTIDTIDLGYGIKELGSKMYLYETLKKVPADEPESDKSLSLDFSNYLLSTGSQKTSLSVLVPNFNNYFSSPGVIGGKIYYWQLNSANRDSAYKISATEYSPLTKEVRSFYITNDFIQTDDSRYLSIPYLKTDTIYFEGGNKIVKKFTPDFKPYN